MDTAGNNAGLMQPELLSSNRRCDNYEAELRAIEQSQHHLTRLSAFINQVNNATQSRWHTRTNHYTDVSALLLSWEPDMYADGHNLSVIEEIENLSKILSKSYRSYVEKQLICTCVDRYMDFLTMLSWFRQNTNFLILSLWVLEILHKVHC
jgi:hypothetical protein